MQLSSASAHYKKGMRGDGYGGGGGAGGGARVALKAPAGTTGAADEATMSTCANGVCCGTTACGHGAATDACDAAADVVPGTVGGG